MLILQINMSCYRLKFPLSPELLIKYLKFKVSRATEGQGFKCLMLV